MFDRELPKKKSSLKKPLNQLDKMLSIEQLFNSPQRKFFLGRIKHLSCLEPERFAHIALQLIYKVAANCQRLPAVCAPYFAESGGLLDQLLYRTDAALELFQAIIVPSEEEGCTPEQMLWAYALLTAGFLQGIGRLYTDYDIQLYDQYGTKIKKWNPLQETLGANAPYYEHSILNRDDFNLTQRTTLLLAQQWMPAAGFAWLASDEHVFSVWLALLQEDTEGAETLAEILNRAKELANLRYLDDLVSRHGGPKSASVIIDGLPSMDDLIGAEFIKWLAGALERGELILNKSGDAMLTPGGIFIPFDKLKIFAQMYHPHLKNWQAIQRAAQHWHVHKKHYETGQSLAHRQLHPTEKVQGFMVDASLAPKHVHIFDGKTKQARQLSVIDTMDLLIKNQSRTAPIKQLSTQGRWEMRSELNLLHTTKGLHHRG